MLSRFLLPLKKLPNLEPFFLDLPSASVLGESLVFSLCDWTQWTNSPSGSSPVWPPFFDPRGGIGGFPCCCCGELIRTFSCWRVVLRYNWMTVTNTNKNERNSSITSWNYSKWKIQHISTYLISSDFRFRCWWMAIWNTIRWFFKRIWKFLSDILYKYNIIK